MIFICLLCVFILHFRKSFSQKSFKKASGVIIVYSGLEKVYFIFYWKGMIGNSLTNHWLDMDLGAKNMAMWTLESCSKPSLAHGK